MNVDNFESPYFAAIDLGSNSFHMLIVRFNETKIEIVDREKEMVQIARGLQQDGCINRDAQDRALECLHRFSERLRDIPKSQIRAVGTKALRSARNSKSFLKAAERGIGVPIEIISGYEEARLVYAGLSNTVTNDHSQRLVIDIGGGSTEFIIGKDYKTKAMESLPLGCVSFSETHFLNAGGVNAKNMRRAYLAACAEIEEIRKNYLKLDWDIAYGTSGTMRAISGLVSETDGGAIITRKSLDKVIAQTITEGEVKSSGVPKLRRDVLPAGLAILHAIFDQLKLDTLHIADATLKEGLIYDTIGRFSDHDARVETVSNLKNQYAIDVTQAERVSKTASYFWSKLDTCNLPGVSRSKILSWAAQLHEIGLSISHSGYHHHGYYILRHSDLAGFARYEQYILANLVRSHHKKINMKRFEELDDVAREAFIPLMVCLRLAARLHRRREDIDELPEFSGKNGKYKLKFKTDWLEQHPLTQAGLEQEKLYYKALGLTLKAE